MGKANMKLKQTRANNDELRNVGPAEPKLKPQSRNQPSISKHKTADAMQGV